MSELGQNIVSDIPSVRLVTKMKGTSRVADSVTAEEHNQAFDVIAKAVSRNSKYVRSYSLKTRTYMEMWACSGSYDDCFNWFPCCGYSASCSGVQ